LKAYEFLAGFATRQALQQLIDKKKTEVTDSEASLPVANTGHHHHFNGGNTHGRQTKVVLKRSFDGDMLLPSTTSLASISGIGSSSISSNASSQFKVDLRSSEEIAIDRHHKVNQNSF
jgi:hypothetical protein